MFNQKLIVPRNIAAWQDLIGILLLYTICCTTYALFYNFLNYRINLLITLNQNLVYFIIFTCFFNDSAVVMKCSRCSTNKNLSFNQQAFILICWNTQVTTPTLFSLRIFLITIIIYLHHPATISFKILNRNIYTLAHK